ncbi:MAG: DNA mismatch endonuclease Vsr [Alphaproteobacteria bacterium]
MVDVISPEARSALMARVKGWNTKPEMVVRSLTHGLGFRFRLHRRDLPGTPDLVFPGRRKVIFVHGCFWHRHAGCKLAAEPKTRQEFWTRKFQDNVERDRTARESLEAAGWKVLVVWECQTRAPAGLAERLSEFLSE